MPSRGCSEAIESALGQTHPNVEIVVVDDGSTDGTLGVACQFEGERVRVIHQKNQGACAARNRAFQESSGDYVQFLDADDILHPEKLERQLRCLAEEPEGTVAIGPWVRFRGAVADADLTWSGPDWRDYEPATDWLLQASGQGGGMPTVVWLTPRTLAEAAGPWNKGHSSEPGRDALRALSRRPGRWHSARAPGILPRLACEQRQQPAERRLSPLELSGRRARRGCPPQPRRGCSGVPACVRGALAGGSMLLCTPGYPELSRKAEETCTGSRGAAPCSSNDPLGPSDPAPVRVEEAALRVQHVL